LYVAYADYNDLMIMVERAMQGLADVVAGSRLITYQGRNYDLNLAFTRITVEEAVARFTPGFDVKRARDLTYLRVYSGKLVAPYEALYAGLGDQRIVTTLCPGGKERMRRLMAMIEHGRIDVSRLLTHRFPLERIEEAFDLFSHQRDGVLKVALYPGGPAAG